MGILSLRLIGTSSWVLEQPRTMSYASMNLHDHISVLCTIFGTISNKLTEFIVDFNHGQFELTVNRSDVLIFELVHNEDSLQMIFRNISECWMQCMKREIVAALDLRDGNHILKSPWKVRNRDLYKAMGGSVLLDRDSLLNRNL
eukprot:TRINITY_DN10574_c0_g2_i2.p2 TRINITY_DN10574_c0_g2~~TRINITY_DN10574_c0_g2_i2.p2  ORF type:complete len:144 (+),score=7.56 TRINITY_DN10574_c0_g2_i2:45-476(+)